MADEIPAPFEVPGPGDPVFDEVHSRAAAFLDVETLARATSPGELLHYLGNRVGYREDKTPEFHALMSDIRDLDPSYDIAGERELFKAEVAQRNVLREESSRVNMWIGANSQRFADDPEVAANLARQSELRELLGGWD